MTVLESLFSEDDKITKILRRIAKIAERESVESYFVGGVVRDRILERETKDVDITVIGNGIEFAEKIARSFRLKKIIKYPKFGTAMVPYHEIQIEVATARSEEYIEDSRKPMVSKGNLRDDLLRRDFTINALAVSLNPGSLFELTDCFQGMKDLNEGIIRTPLDPITTFSEDPLRMLRAIRFATQLRFHIEEKTFDAIAEVKDRMKIISQERITDELMKILAAPKPSTGFELMDKCGLLRIILPEIAIMKGIDQRRDYHHKDVFRHTLQVLDNVCEKTEKQELRFTALVHDIAKPRTKRFIDGKGWTFHGHEIVGIKMIKHFCLRLKLPNKLMKYAQNLTRLHLRPIALADEGITDSALRRLMVDAGEHFDDLMLLCRADITSKNIRKAREYDDNFARVEQMVRDVEERDKLRAFQSPFRGDEIIKHFNILPGPVVGIIKKNIEEAILNGEIENDHEAAKEYIIQKNDFFVGIIKKIAK